MAELAVSVGRLESVYILHRARSSSFGWRSVSNWGPYAMLLWSSKAQ